MHYLLVLLTLFSTAFGAQKIALSFDDFPMPTSSFYEKKERAQLYMEKLKKLEVQAVFFCIGSQLEKDQICLKMAQEYNQLLANHSISHTHLSAQSIDSFKEEIFQLDTVLDAYQTHRKWFRFPYLDFGDREKIGGSGSKRVDAFKALRQMGYLHGYTTINTFDWYINGVLLKNRQADLEVVKKDYLLLLDQWIESYHTSWKRHLRRPFCHVLLLHQNDLNLLFLEDIVGLIRDKGWEIVSPDEAFSHPIRRLAKYGHSFANFTHPLSLSTEYIDHFLTFDKIDPVHAK